MQGCGAEELWRAGPRSRHQTLHRWIALAGVVGVEYALLSMAIDADPSRATGGAGAWLEFLGTGAAMSFIVVSAALAVWDRRLGPGLGALEPTAPTRLLALGLVHAGAFAALWGATGIVFGGATAPRPVLAALWGLLLLAVPTTALAAAFRLRGLVSLASRLRPLMGWALLVGALTWAAAAVSRSLGTILAHLTVDLAGSFLGLLSRDAFSDPTTATLGIGSFGVQVAPFCSGYEGVGLIVVLVTAYLVAARRGLRFPRALLLLPLSVLLVILANALRISSLVLVGASGFPALAMGGFHAKAGWVLFCAVAIGVVTWARGSPFLQKETPFAAEGRSEPAAYLLPLLAWLAAGMVTGLFTTGWDRWYAIRLLPALAILWAYRRSYPRPARPSWLVGPAFGIAAYGLWIVLAQGPHEAGQALAATVGGLGSGERAAWLSARTLGAVLVVPVVEELAFRGYALRRLVGADFTAVSYRNVTAASVLISSLVFGLLHQHVIAGTLAGILFAMAAQRRGRLGDAIVAHGVCNALIALEVLLLGHWQLWS